MPRVRRILPSLKINLNPTTEIIAIITIIKIKRIFLYHPLKCFRIYIYFCLFFMISYDSEVRPEKIVVQKGRREPKKFENRCSKQSFNSAM